ncbi:dITP/XTP pyrophosphatase [Campylobacter majalis]|uniref:dITP/XTP pyrophosphatase n=1 Tax=Campylobacter majalis TaxID=2790656 RepID=A0ABN7K7E8_9BACT|nr:non-canonical purine NTP pyrophosphatase [Campylobacter majalis]CAD7287561.1 dITP/XTP pyrophosphatase [Campylobacter majalis]
MKIVLATSNKDKVKEIKEYLKEYEILALSDVIEPFEIVEDGDSFKQNALIKARAVYEKVSKIDENYVVLSDDSGISVNALGLRPGIHSARYSGENATDATNRKKLIDELNALSLEKSDAYYTACIAVVSKYGEYTTHGFMHGVVINQELGKNGFGYDFMFIANGFDKTIAQLDESVKLEISHRSKGLELAKYVLKMLAKKL